MQEIVFAQRLVDNEEKVRNRALKKLKKYLRIKSKTGSAILHDEALKLWKGLFYCMYMADKPLFQENVAEEISGLIHCITNEEDCKTFVKAGFLTFAREWNGIDVFRIDKYMMFIRRFLRHVFMHLQASEWALKKVMAYTNILEMTVVCPDDDCNKTPLGLKTHVCEIILEELAKIGGENLQHPVIMAVIQPYLKVLALTKINTYSKFVREGIIRHLIFQGLCAEEEERGEEEQGQTKEANNSVLIMEEETQSYERGEVSVALDPRAGRVDTYIPQLKMDFNLLADSLQKIGAVSRVQTKNREVIYRLVCELRDAAQGFNPLASTSDNIDDVEVPENEIEKAVERLEEFEKDLRAGNLTKPDGDDADYLKHERKQDQGKYRKMRFRRYMRKRSLKPKGLSKATRRKLDKHQQKLAQKRLKAVEHMVKQVTTTSGIPRNSFNNNRNALVEKTFGFEVSFISPQKKTSKTRTSSNKFIVEMASSVIKKEVHKDSKKANKEKCSGISVSDLKSSAELKNSFSNQIDNVLDIVAERRDIEKENQESGIKKPLVKLVKASALSNIDKASQQIEKLKTEQEDDKSLEKAVKKVMSDTHISTQTTRSFSMTTPHEKDKYIENISKTEKLEEPIHQCPKPKSPFDEPLLNGEYEFFVKCRKAVTNTRKKKINPIKKRLSANIPKQRTININLKKNREHDFSDYVRTIRASPSIPFKADKAPKAPVLKHSSSPILVKRPSPQKQLLKVACGSRTLQSKHFKRQTAADFF